MKNQTMSQIVDKMKSGAKLHKSKARLILPNGTTEKVSKLMVKQLVIKYYEELVFDEKEGIRFEDIELKEGLVKETSSNSLEKQIVIKGKISNEQMFDIINPIIEYSEKNNLSLHIKSNTLDESVKIDSQKVIELMQLLEMIEVSLQNGNNIKPDSFIIRNSIRILIGLEPFAIKEQICCCGSCKASKE